jgi:hypothetical protein
MPPIVEGWLKKSSPKSKGFHIWQARYCTLEQDGLYYYAKMKQTHFGNVAS